MSFSRASNFTSFRLHLFRETASPTSFLAPKFLTCSDDDDDGSSSSRSGQARAEATPTPTTWKGARARTSRKECARKLQSRLRLVSMYFFAARQHLVEAGHVHVHGRETYEGAFLDRVPERNKGNRFFDTLNWFFRRLRRRRPRPRLAGWLAEFYSFFSPQSFVRNSPASYRLTDWRDVVLFFNLCR